MLGQHQQRHGAAHSVSSWCCKLISGKSQILLFAFDVLSTHSQQLARATASAATGLARALHPPGRAALSCPAELLLPGAGQVSQYLQPPERPPPLACQGPLASGHQYSHATSPAATFGLLITFLQVYSVLQALGYELSSVLFGPWLWWVLALVLAACSGTLRRS
ncbi:hypothetical protein E2320_004553 [Naja naja]|nr:hypothetical protein E2320_004553 [Naja naja]